MAASVYQWAGSDSPRSSAASRLPEFSIALVIALSPSHQNLKSPSAAANHFRVHLRDTAASTDLGLADLVRNGIDSNKIALADSSTPQKLSQWAAVEASAAVPSIPIE